MSRPILATLLAFGLALPAQADLDRRDAARIIGGLAALYLLNDALEQSRQGQPDPQDQPSVARSRSAPPPVTSGTYSHIHADGSGGGTWHEHPVGQSHATAPHPVATPPQVARDTPPYQPPVNRSVDIRLIPTQCRADATNPVEIIEGYDATCMQNAVVLPGSLPPQCLREVPSGTATRTVYEGA
ncbi:MAG: hypothetical protein WBA67_08225, partial [Jannaschia sp.]